MPEGDQRIIMCSECDFGWTEEMGERHAETCSRNREMEVRRRFEYYPPTTDDRVRCHQAVRHCCDAAAIVVMEVAPEGRERSLALTKLEEAMFWANAAIARGVVT